MADLAEIEKVLHLLKAEHRVIHHSQQKPTANMDILILSLGITLFFIHFFYVCAV